MNFSKLDQLIKNSPLRKSDIIAQSGISKATLDNVIKGMDAKVSTIEAIAQVLGVSPAVFFDETPTEYQNNDHGTINGHHQHHISVNDSKVLEKTISEIAEHRKLIEKSQEHISDLTKALLNLTTNKKKK